MEIVLLWLFLSGLVAVWASNKGRSALGYFLLSALLSPLIGFIAVAIASPNIKKLDSAAIAAGDSKKCPICAETIKREALKCRYCGSDLPVESTEPPKKEFFA